MPWIVVLAFLSAAPDVEGFKLAEALMADGAFEAAAQKYLAMAEGDPTGAALNNAAVCFESLGQLDRAVELYERMVRDFPKSQDAPKRLFRAGLIYEKQANHPKVISTFEAFVRKYAKDELAIDAQRRIAEALQEQKKHPEAKKAFAAAADLFDRRKLKSEAHPIAADAAASSRFALAEYELEKFEALKVGGSGAELERSLAAKKHATSEAGKLYDAVLGYRRIEWTLAASYRRTYLFDAVLRAVRNTPVPPGRSGYREDSSSRATVAPELEALDQNVAKEYALLVAEARKQEVDTHWTRRALESLQRVCATCPSCAACDCKPPDGGTAPDFCR